MCVALGWRLLVGGERYANAGDAIVYVLMGWDEKTAYASGFTERGFRELRPGMTESDVKARIGTPVKTSLDGAAGARVLWYSSGDMERTFWMRYVAVDSTGHVTEVIRQLWFD